MTDVRFDFPFANSKFGRRFLFGTSFHLLFLVFIASFCVFVVGAEPASEGAGVVPSVVAESAENKKTLNRPLVPKETKEISKSELNRFLSSERVLIPASVEMIEDDAFDELDAFAQIQVAKNNPYFQSVDGALLTKKENALIRAVAQTDGVVVVPNGTKRIARKAFNFHTSIKRVSIPSSVEEIDYAELWQWRGAAQIEVAEDNPFYQSVGGSLLKKVDKTLVYCPVDSKGIAVTPEGTKKIDIGSACFDSSLKLLRISSSVEEITLGMFRDLGRSASIEVAENNPVFLSVDGSLLTKKDKTLIYGRVDSTGFGAVPDGTKIIDYDAFGHRVLKRVWIPSSVEEIKDGALWIYGDSAWFEVDEENRFFKSVDGALVTKDGTKLIHGVIRPDGSAVMPDGVKKLDHNSFDFHFPIKLIFIPASVEEIELDFFESHSLTTRFANSNLTARFKVADLTTRFEVAEENPFYQSVDGSLLTKEDKTLLRGVLRSDGSVVAPDGTKRIDIDAFKFCTSIERVWIPASVEKIENDVFKDLNDTTQIEVAENNPFFQIVDGALLTKNDKTLVRTNVNPDGSFVIPEGTKKMDESACVYDFGVRLVLIPSSFEQFGKNVLDSFFKDVRFEVAKDNPFFQSVDGSLMGKDGETLISCYVSSVDNSAIIPEGTKKIGAETFRPMSSLERVWIPSSVEEIKKDLFELNDLSHFEVAEDNPFYQSVDGSLLTKEDKTLLRGSVSPDGFVVVPYGTKRIDANAFNYRASIKRVWIPSSVEEIEKEVFTRLKGTPRFEVAENNPFFQTVGGALLTKSDKTLLYVISNPNGVFVIPEGTKKLDACACMTKSRINRVLIPASFEQFGNDALRYFCGAVRFEVVKDSPYFQSVDGSLLRKDDQTLLHCYVSSRDGSAVVPDGTKKIDAKVCGSLLIKIISIPSSVETIDPKAFDVKIPIICGFSNSTAERYAEKYGFPFRRIDKTD